MELQLTGLRALVTGAAGGIGAAVARALATEGVRLALVDRAAPDGWETSVALSLAADVTDEQAVAHAVAATEEAFGGIDLLVCCAGISGPVGTSLAETRLEDWRRVVEVNVTGTFLAMRAAIPVLRRSASAAIVVIASDSALVAAPGMAAYCASKAAVLHLVRASAVEVAGDGIRVNAVCPSVVDTPMSRGDLGLDGGFAGVEYPVQSAAEVAAQVAFLCSPVSRPIVGAGIVSDFGFSARSAFPA